MGENLRRGHETVTFVCYNKRMSNAPTPDTTTLEPPSNSSTSIVLNGMGNGMMLGTLPFVAFELYSHLVTKKPISTQAYKGMAFALVGGCALGTAYGFHEAKQVRQYREGISSEVDSLRNELNETKAKLESWTQKHDARASHDDGHSR